MSPASLYRMAARLLQPVLPLYLRYRLARDKEIGSRLQERYGIASRLRPDGTLIWIHGASVGEMMSVLPLLDCLLQQNEQLHVLLTSGTVASANLIGKRLPARTVHQFIPLDTPAYSQRFLEHWRPNAAFWLESELWPNMLGEMQRRNIPAARLNARLTERSAEGWKKHPAWFRQLLATFKLSLPIGVKDAERLQQAGAPDVRFIGNLKFTAPPPSVDRLQLDELKQCIGNRPVWLMASSHPGEEELAQRMHAQLAPLFPELLTIIAPRHTKRADEVASLLKSGTPRRSLGQLPQTAQAFYLADTMGEMGLLYETAGLAVIGGSFTPKGGHSPVEPAQCSCAAIIGPDTSKCEDAVSELVNAGALYKVQSETELLPALRGLLENAEKRRAMQVAGQNATQQQAALLSAFLTALTPLLGPLGVRTA